MRGRRTIWNPRHARSRGPLPRRGGASAMRFLHEDSEFSELLRTVSAAQPSAAPPLGKGSPSPSPMPIASPDRLPFTANHSNPVCTETGEAHFLGLSARAHIAPMDTANGTSAMILSRKSLIAMLVVAGLALVTTGCTSDKAADSTKPKADHPKADHPKAEKPQ